MTARQEIEFWFVVVLTMAATALMVWDIALMSGVTV